MVIDSRANCLQIVEKGVKENNIDKSRKSIIENYWTLNIATYNINEVKNNVFKLKSFLEQASQEKINIIGANKTNTTEKQSKYNMNRQEKYLKIQTIQRKARKKALK